MAEALDDLREFIEYRVREGFETAQKIVENACRWAWFRYKRDDLLPEVERLTSEALTAHQAEQATWGPTTDCDRLDTAFAALNEQGIVARQDFSCCNNCGFTEIWDEIEEVEQQQHCHACRWGHYRNCTGVYQYQKSTEEDTTNKIEQKFIQTELF